MIKGAIFDVDGTLLDSMPTWHDLGSRYLRRLGLDAEPGLNEKLFTLSFEEGAAYMRERYHLSQDPADDYSGNLTYDCGFLCRGSGF